LVPAAGLIVVAPAGQLLETTLDKYANMCSMGNSPDRPLRQIEHAVECDDLEEAVVVARDYARAHGRPIPLASASKLLPLIARQSPSEYDAYALRFLDRWIDEKARTIDEVADLAAALAELPENPKVQLPL
jgi:hypothetical protein